MRRRPSQGPPGARQISTEQFQRAQQIVAYTARHEAVSVIYGDTGLGKTYAMRRGARKLLEARARGDRTEVTLTQFPMDWTRLQIAKTLLKSITGEDFVGNNGKATNRLLDVLTATPRLLIVDEAQQLNEKSIEFLRFLHDHDETRFGLLFVGGNGCWRVLSSKPMLRSRISQRQEFKALLPVEVPSLMRAYHPLYRDADDDLITYVDESYANGQWRSWAIFSFNAVEVAQRVGRSHIDWEIVENTFAMNPPDERPSHTRRRPPARTETAAEPVGTILASRTADDAAR
ncbi:ATP-binding protein [Catenuloplanes atrovinosus]|uniref:ORC1/DEAH AAA+ ATPase domain-containing protein n=1 Tax=Catenuloplanes atrovinosus TaxID=137266 RepID=A0AAE3YP02_9ACTN|nr:ATP-binding protein [Catenuloplanes atrovinosus]MDR7276002.1 hypothetical protein [Catenuloplanes atrovinosus]